MDIVNPNSLSKTLDALNEVFFFKQPITQLQKEQVASWLASRQGKYGSYASMFAPTELDFRVGAGLFTGETVPSRAATAHILGEEACRALILLDVPFDSVSQALKRASLGMIGRLSTETGIYCCGKCTAALWRHLEVGGLKDYQCLLPAGLEALKTRRDGEGRWRTFPFYYTLLALSEMDNPLAIEEMRYASPVCERYLKKAIKGDKVTQRRQNVIERVLEKC